MNLDLIRRPAVLGTIAGVIVLALIWWFAWMSPEGNKLATVNGQATSLQSQIAGLNTEIGTLKSESQQLNSVLPYLAFFQLAIPPLPESGVLTEELYNLSLKTGTFISALDDSATAATGQGYSVIPVAMSVSGSHDSMLAFLKGLYTLPRLITVQAVSLIPPAGASNLNLPSKVSGFQATISASAYTTFQPAPASS